MLVIAIAFFFWPLVLWLYLRELRWVVIITVFSSLFYYSNSDLLKGDITVVMDLTPLPFEIVEIDRFLEKTNFSELFRNLQQWDPFTNLGIRAHSITEMPYYFPEPLIYLNHYLGIFSLDPPSLANLYIMFRVVGFATGMLLLVSFLTQNKWIGLFVFFSCLFSNLLGSNLLIGTLVSIFWYPYMLYFYLAWFRKGTHLSFLIFFIILSISTAMHYPEEPVYLMFFFIIFYGILQSGMRGFPKKIVSILPRRSTMLIAIIFSTFILSPRIFHYFELRDQIFPRSGLTQGLKPRRAEIKDVRQLHNQHPARLSDYNAMVLGLNYMKTQNRHGVWNYAGPLVLFFAALSLILGYNTDRRKIIFSLFFSAVMIGIISFGSKTPLFLLTDKIPLLNQGSSPIYHVSSVFFLLVLMSGFGLLLFLEVLYKDIFWKGLIILALSVSYIAFGGVLKQTMGIAVAGIFITVLFFVIRYTINSGRFKIGHILNVAVGLIITLAAFQLVPFQRKLVMQLGRPFANLPVKHFKVPITRSHITNPDLRDLEGVINTTIYSTVWPHLNKEPTIGASTMTFTRSYELRTSGLLNVIYPGRKNIETLKEDISRTVYNHREPILGYDFPIFFFVPHAEVIPKAIVQNEARLSRTLMRMADYYKRGNPENVFFFEGDDMPPKLSKAVASTEFSGIVEVSIDQERSTPHEVFGKVNAPQDGYIVRLENYHSDWNIRIDGEKERIYYGNYAFQAFPISKGNHELHWTFDTPFPMFFLMYQFAFYTGFVLFIWYGYRYGSHSNSNRLPPHSE